MKNVAETLKKMGLLYVVYTRDEMGKDKRLESDITNFSLEEAIGSIDGYHLKSEIEKYRRIMVHFFAYEGFLKVKDAEVFLKCLGLSEKQIELDVNYLEKLEISHLRTYDGFNISYMRGERKEFIKELRKGNLRVEDYPILLNKDFLLRESFDPEEAMVSLGNRIQNSVRNLNEVIESMVFLQKITEALKKDMEAIEI